MEILKVYPKNVYTTLELSAEELEFILEYLDNCVAHLNLKEEFQRKCNDFITGEFFTKLQALSNDIKQMR